MLAPKLFIESEMDTLHCRAWVRCGSGIWLWSWLDVEAQSIRRHWQKDARNSG